MNIEVSCELVHEHGNSYWRVSFPSLPGMMAEDEDKQTALEELRKQYVTYCATRAKCAKFVLVK